LKSYDQTPSRRNSISRYARLLGTIGKYIRMTFCPEHRSNNDQDCINFDSPTYCDNVIKDNICVVISVLYLKLIVYAQHDIFLLYFRHAHTWCIVYKTNLNIIIFVL
jgi:hypothetical protein